MELVYTQNSEVNDVLMIKDQMSIMSNFFKSVLSADLSISFGFFTNRKTLRVFNV